MDEPEDQLWDFGWCPQSGIWGTKTGNAKAALAMANRVQDVGEEGFTEELSPIRGLAEVPPMSLIEAVNHLTDTVPYIEGFAQLSIDYAESLESIPAGLEKDDFATIIVCTWPWDELGESLIYMMNRKLRSTKRKELKPFLPLLKLFLLAIGKFPSHTGPIWCGTKGDLTSMYREGNELTWWGLRSFTSSIRPLLTPSFLGKSGPRTLFTLETNRGHKIELPTQETEIILPPGLLMRVHNIFDAGDDLKVIEMKEITPVVSLIDFPRTAFELGSVEYFLRELDDAASEGNAERFLQILKTLRPNLEAYLYENAFATFTDLYQDRCPDETAVSDLIKLILAVMEVHRDNGQVQAKSCSALHILCRNGFNKAFISRHNTISSVVTAMRHHLHREDVITAGCVVLQHLLHNDRNRVVAAKQGAIEAVLSAMRHHEYEYDVQENTYPTLCLLSINHNNQISIAAQDGIVLITTGMKRHEDHVQVLKYGCLVLARLFANQKIAVAGENEIKSVIVAMEKHPDSQEIQQNGCLALARISHFKDIQEFTRAQGGVSLVLLAMATYPENNMIQQNASMALACLACDGENRRIIVKEGGLALVLTAMKSHMDSAGVQESGCKSLVQLSKHSRNERLVEEPDKAEVVTAAMERHIEHGGVQINGCLALENLGATEKTTWAVLRAMKEHPKHRALHECGLKVLAQMSFQVESSKRIIRDGGMHLTVSAMRRFMDHPAIQQSGCLLIARLCKDEEDQTIVAHLGGIEAATRAMEERPFHSGIQRHGCFALARLSQTPENHSTMRKVDCGEVVRKALKNHRQDEALETHGNDFQRNLWY